MSHAAKRKVVQHLQEEHPLLQRRACRLVSCNRKSVPHISKRPDDAELRAALLNLAQQKPAWGYCLLHGALRLGQWSVNHKKVYRLYREEKLVLRKKGKKRVKCEKRGARLQPTEPGQQWAMDFIHDALADGRSFRTLNLTDNFTRQCLGQEVDTSLSGRRVVRLLDQIAQTYSLPAEIQVDNGPERQSLAVDTATSTKASDVLKTLQQLFRARSTAVFAQ